MQVTARPSVRPTNLLILMLVPATFATLLGSMSRVHWVCDLCAQLAVQCAAFQALGTLLLLAARRYRWAAGFFVVAVLAGWPAAPLFRSPRVGSSAPTGGRLRVMAVNLLRQNEDHAAVLGAVRAERPDLLVCTELTPEWARALAPLAAELPHVVSAPEPGWFGIALHSRLPIREYAVVSLGAEWARAIRAVVDTPAGALGVLAAHAPQPGGARRNAERDLAYVAMPAQLAMLPPRRIVVGDLNSTRFGGSFADLLAATGLRDSGEGFGLQPTWPAQLPFPMRIAIDHVLVPPMVAVVDRRVGPDVGSDHLPLVVDLQL
jgi:endonuclease/exonuclease/phosphatase (EEP) superfamily protein YafD